MIFYHDSCLSATAFAHDPASLDAGCHGLPVVSQLALFKKKRYIAENHNKTQTKRASPMNKGKIYPQLMPSSDAPSA
jgi:hypothetical protein